VCRQHGSGLGSGVYISRGTRHERRVRVHAIGSGGLLQRASLALPSGDQRLSSFYVRLWATLPERTDFPRGRCVARDRWTAQMTANIAHALDAGLRFCVIRASLARASDAQRWASCYAIAFSRRVAHRWRTVCRQGGRGHWVGQPISSNIGLFTILRLR
jgi:hypothetical protein